MISFFAPISFRARPFGEFGERGTFVPVVFSSPLTPHHRQAEVRWNSFSDSEADSVNEGQGSSFDSFVYGGLFTSVPEGEKDAVFFWRSREGDRDRPATSTTTQ